MWRLGRFPARTRWSAALPALGAAAALACSADGSRGSVGPTYVETPVCDAADPAQVVAPQRIVMLTSTELMNTVRLVSDDAAQMIIDRALFPVLPDLNAVFPPPRNEQIKYIPDSTTAATFDTMAQAVGNFVHDNFAALTQCPSPATDACAAAYLAKLAVRAYRRQLTADEQARFTDLYSTLRSQLAAGYQVTLSVEEATGYAVYALFMAPQVLWRWELGAAPSPLPQSLTLTDSELASSLSFFLTDRPPDDLLLAEAQAGTLQANLTSHVDRLLATQAARDWLSHVMNIYFFLNKLPATQIDSSLFPVVKGGTLYGDLQTEAQLFLADLLWNGKVMDLLTSRKAFPNSNLATLIYDVPAPGATPTTFVETTLPSDKRSGMLTNAGFITTRFRSTGVGLVPRGLAVKALFTCIETEGGATTTISPATQQAIDQAATLPAQTAQQQVAFRQQFPECGPCHASFDPYGLALDFYDVVGRYRTVDDIGQPVDAHTTLPAVVGGQTVQNAIDMADALASSDIFTNCLAARMLQYGLFDATVELPLPSAQQKGCAAAGIAHALRHSDGQSFSDLVRAVATSPAFLQRQQTP
jgi:hypothetical protein